MCVNSAGSFQCICDLGYTDIGSVRTWSVEGTDSFRVEWKDGEGDDVFFSVENPASDGDGKIRMSSSIGGAAGQEETVYWARPGRKVTIQVTQVLSGFEVLVGGKALETPWLYTISIPSDKALTATTAIGDADVVLLSTCADLDECVLGLHNCEVLASVPICSGDSSFI